jgi:hypothetical protein
MLRVDAGLIVSLRGSIEIILDIYVLPLAKPNLEIKKHIHVVDLGAGGHWLKSRNHERTTIGCFLFIGRKNSINLGSTIGSSLNCKTCDYI